MQKILNFFTLLSFQLGYIEWGGKQSAFIFQAEAEIFRQASNHPESFFHPLILIQLLGMVLLVITLFQQTPRKGFTVTGIVCLAVLMLLLAFIGIIDRNARIFCLTLPFIIFSILALRTTLKKRS